MKKFFDDGDDIFPWHLHPVQLYELALDEGVSKKELLHHAGLKENELEQSDLHVSWLQYRQMALTMNQSGPENWGFLLGKRLTLSSHGIMSLAVMNCHSWRQALELVSTYKVLVSPLLFLDIEEAGQYVFMTARPEFIRDPLIPHFMECFFTTVYLSLLHI